MATLAIIGNPKKRRKAKTSARKTAKRRANPARKASASRRTPVKARRYALTKRKGIRRVRRTNPIGLKGLKGLLMPAGVGAASAVIIHEIYSKLATKFSASIPAMLQGGMGQIAAEAALALAINVGLEKTKLIKDAKTRQAILMGALTGLGIKAIQESGIVAKAMGAAGMSGYQLIDTASLSGYQLANAPTPALGYMNSSPSVGVMPNVRNFRKNRTS